MAFGPDARPYVAHSEGAQGGQATVMRWAGEPGAPTGLAATAGNAQASLQWSAPVDTVDSALIDYMVTASPGGSGRTATARPLRASSAAVTNGQACSFTVMARNGAGPSVLSSPATPAIAPQAPHMVAVVNCHCIVFDGCWD